MALHLLDSLTQFMCKEDKLDMLSSVLSSKLSHNLQWRSFIATPLYTDKGNVFPQLTINRAYEEHVAFVFSRIKTGRAKSLVIRN